ncbi:hypothetical protein HaLaN_30656, partial [Haematococcus lacustris]
MAQMPERMGKFYTEWREKQKKRAQLNAWAPTQDSPQQSSSSSGGTPANLSSPQQPQGVEGQGASGSPQTGGALSQQPQLEQPNPDLLQPSFQTPMPAFFNLDNPLVFTAV